MKSKRGEGKTILFGIFMICMILLGVGSLFNFPPLFHVVISGIFIVAALGIPLRKLNVGLAFMSGLFFLAVFLTGRVVEVLQPLSMIVLFLAIVACLIYIYFLPAPKIARALPLRKAREELLLPCLHPPRRKDRVNS